MTEAEIDRKKKATERFIELFEQNTSDRKEFLFTFSEFLENEYTIQELEIIYALAKYGAIVWESCQHKYILQYSEIELKQLKNSIGYAILIVANTTERFYREENIEKYVRKE